MSVPQLTDTGVLLDRVRDQINKNFGFSVLGGPWVPLAASAALDATQSGAYMITKGGVAALTLGAPAADSIVIVLSSNTAYAHTLTATGLLQTGAAGTGLLTFAAHPGATVILVSFGGQWNVISNNDVTVTS